MSKAAKRGLELYRKEAVQAAKDLCYPHKILGLLAIAESENEILPDHAFGKMSLVNFFILKV